MMRRIIIAVFVILALGAAPVAQAESGDDAARSIFELFDGEWRSDGSAFGVPASSRMVWTPALDGKYVRLDYGIEMQPAQGAASTFQGVAYYRDAGGSNYKAFWADNSGDLHPISAQRDGDALVAHWGAEGSKQGRTRYQLSAPGKLEVTDWIKTADGWRQFNHNVFERAPTAN